MAPATSTRSVTQIPRTFPLQSYHDTLLLERAIRQQPQGAAIVPLTRAQAQIPGIGVALHPSSESPVAIRFRGGSADSSELILTPGQQMIVGDFTSFDWGLPFGWLGGGTVLLYVVHRPDVALGFPSGAASPVVFQRLTLFIGPRVSPNWPLTFPWGSAVSGVGPAPQGGAPIVNVTPVAAMFRLRSVPATPVTLSLIWTDTDTFDIGADGVTPFTPVPCAADLSFPMSSDGAAFPLAWLDPALARIGGNSTSLQVTDPSGLLTNQFIDVARYGTLG